MEKLDHFQIPSPYIQQALTASQMGLFMINLQGEILYMNDLAHLYFKPQTSFLNSHMLENYSDPTRTTLNHAHGLKPNFWQLFPDRYLGFSMKEALQFGACPSKIYRSFFQKELEIQTFFIFEGEKQDHGLLITIKDITANVLACQNLQRKSQLEKLGAMLHEISHEIRNPLGGIRGYASLLFRDLDCHKNLQQMASTIVDATKSLEKMIGQILQFAKPISLECKTTEMNQFLRKFIKFVKEDMACQNVHFDLHLTENQVYAPIDLDAMQRAFVNIILNAIQAMKEGGILTVSLLKKDLDLEISFADTGIGICETDLEKIFTPYFTTKESGSGLGLSLTQKIIQAHGGKIFIRSHLNKGTVVSILLPLSRG